MKITLCAGCAPGQAAFAARLGTALEAAGLSAGISLIDCMSGCARPSTCAFRAPGKTAYLFGDLTEADMADLVTFARHYAASADGNLPDARVLGPLRKKALARIPG
jgi:predicted metal-binding protein